MISRLHGSYTAGSQRLYAGYMVDTRWLHDGCTSVTCRLHVGYKGGYATVLLLHGDGASVWSHHGYTVIKLSKGFTTISPLAQHDCFVYIISTKSDALHHLYKHHLSRTWYMFSTKNGISFRSFYKNCSGVINQSERGGTACAINKAYPLGQRRAWQP